MPWKWSNYFSPEFLNTLCKKAGLKEGSYKNENIKTEENLAYADMPQGKSAMR